MTLPRPWCRTVAGDERYSLVADRVWASGEVLDKRVRQGVSHVCHMGAFFVPEVRNDSRGVIDACCWFWLWAQEEGFCSVEREAGEPAVGEHRGCFGEKKSLLVESLVCDVYTCCVEKVNEFVVTGSAQDSDGGSGFGAVTYTGQFVDSGGEIVHVGQDPFGEDDV
ncbi:hypothetical protein, partial [Enterobacter sp. Cy-1797]|uniref:hypothetical protein n=1 Tax=Enterobacter sp. Cy-1797 TaxID=2608342 RepID=UPI001419CC76